jgi:hypothetical protein
MQFGTIANLADQEKSNGGQFYFGTWMTMVCLAFYFAGRKQLTSWNRMMTASILFSFSIAMRTIDLTICDNWPNGTHLLWHLSNAGVLYFVVKTYVDTLSITQDARTREG